MLRKEKSNPNEDDVRVIGIGVVLSFFIFGLVYSATNTPSFHEKQLNNTQVLGDK